MQYFRKEKTDWRYCYSILDMTRTRENEKFVEMHKEIIGDTRVLSMCSVLEASIRKINKMLTVYSRLDVEKHRELNTNICEAELLIFEFVLAEIFEGINGRVVI